MDDPRDDPTWGWREEDDGPEFLPILWKVTALYHENEVMWLAEEKEPTEPGEVGLHYVSDLGYRCFVLAVTSEEAIDRGQAFLQIRLDAKIRHSL